MVVSWIAGGLGVPESALRLLLSVLIAYPIVIVYRLYFYNNSNFTKNHTNLLFSICGIAICIFNYGIEVYHSLIAVAFTYVIINLMYKSRYLVPVSFIFHMSYLLAGYYKTSTQNYDICWTMCHCVLVLHLIGLTFDVADSVKNPEVLGISENRPIPNLLEVFAFSYFPPTVLIGPQFSFKRYSDFLNKKFEGTENMKAGMKRFLTGVLYLAIYQGMTIFIPDDHFLSDNFKNSNFLYKVFLLSIWGHKTLYKYISCWILSEGAAICCGLTYVSRDEKTGKEDWSGCANIKLRIFENTYHFGDYISAFNVQTNLWVFQYVYKRLKFLNNKNLSHISALLFLAVWHGFHSGYYMTFFLEFLLVHFEKQIIPIAKGNPKLQAYFNTIPGRIIGLAVVKFYTWPIAGYCLIPFVYLGIGKWWEVYKSFYFFGHIVIFPLSVLWLPVLVKIINTFFPIEKNDQKPSDQHEKAN